MFRGFSDEGNGLADALALPLFMVACLICVCTIYSMPVVLREEFQPKRRLHQAGNDVEMRKSFLKRSRLVSLLPGEDPVSKSPWGGRWPAKRAYYDHEEMASVSRRQGHGLHETPHASPVYSKLKGEAWPSWWDEVPEI